MQSFQLSSDGAYETTLRGRQLLRHPGLNKGVAFDARERDQLGLKGLLPPAILSLDDQAARAYHQYQQIPDDAGRAVMLGALYSRNQVLYYRVLADHLAQMLPVVYTPTIGTVIQQYSREFRRPGGVYLSIDDQDGIDEALRNFGLGGADVDLIVVTDGEGILGIGDWGAGGIAIAIGKLAVYTAAAGIDPARVIPVVLDAGTNNEGLLADPFYVGNRHRRVPGAEFDRFVDLFVQRASALFPHALLHWEDLGTDNARRIIQRYRDQVCTFNDDMQGTGAVVLAAVLAGSAAARTPLSDHRVVVFGAGTAGVGIADQICSAMVRAGLPENEARQRFWCIGRRGLLTVDDPRLRDFQERYARSPQDVAGWPRTDGEIPLLDVVRQVHPTILIGTSGRTGAFTQDVVQEMSRHVEQPMILPLSNPTSLAEAVPADIGAWTGGRALVATGSPFAPYTQDRITYVTAQANNALVFPGLGLGTIVSGAATITDAMLAAAADAVAGLVDASAPGAPILPQVDDLQAVSIAVATQVARTAEAEGVARTTAPDWEDAVRAAMWKPVYRPIRAI